MQIAMMLVFTSVYSSNSILDQLLELLFSMLLVGILNKEGIPKLISETNIYLWDKYFHSYLNATLGKR